MTLVDNAGTIQKAFRWNRYLGHWVVDMTVDCGVETYPLRAGDNYTRDGVIINVSIPEGPRYFGDTYNATITAGFCG